MHVAKDGSISMTKVVTPAAVRSLMPEQCLDAGQPKQAESPATTPEEKTDSPPCVPPEVKAQVEEFTAMLTARSLEIKANSRRRTRVASHGGLLEEERPPTTCHGSTI